MNEREVIAYLKEHPDFLLTHGEEIYPTPVKEGKTNSNKVRSIWQLRLMAMDRKLKDFSLQLDCLNKLSQENFALAHKIIQFNQALLKSESKKEVKQEATRALKDIFNLPHHRLFIWPEIGLSSAAEKAMASLNEIKTGHQLIHPDLYNDFAKPLALESFIHLPLKDEQGLNFALLLIGHSDPNYFTSNLSTDYVAWLAQSLAIALNHRKEEK